jgi:hypothetical protein
MGCTCGSDIHKVGMKMHGVMGKWRVSGGPSWTLTMWTVNPGTLTPLNLDSVDSASVDAESSRGDSVQSGFR